MDHNPNEFIRNDRYIIDILQISLIEGLDILIS